MQFVPDPTPPEPRDEASPSHGEEIINRLRAGDLPQMVDWFDPGLLAKVGVRSVISATLGQYTDQRLIQAATDNVSEKELKTRYDYSKRDPGGAVWVDYLADLGDGFEATYAMAYLIAGDELKVRGWSDPLPAGELLIMGGDQVYPDATKHDYDTRLRDPYDWAFNTHHPKRKVFAIPGNHDWYDGLSSFSALFCSARDRISGGIGTQLGGWRCHQHRSYFAIKLPYNWWIWGPDIQLADNLDDPQRDYFDLMADQTQPGDNIILCLAEPSWLHKSYDNLHEISMLARKRGAKICAVLAGDWHHYSRYTNEDLGTQFITSGGGGAFTHATHGLKKNIKISWASPTGAGKSVSSSSDTAEFNRAEKSVMGQGGPDFTQRNVDVRTQEDKPNFKFRDLSRLEELGGRLKSERLRKEDIHSTAYDFEAPAIYPSRGLSRLLCLRNLWLPLHNRKFAVLVGVIYFLYAWAFVAADTRHSPILNSLRTPTQQEAHVAEHFYNRAQERAAAAQKRYEERLTRDGATAATTVEAKLDAEEAQNIITDMAGYKTAIDARRQAVEGETGSRVRAILKDFADKHPPEKPATREEEWNLAKTLAFVGLQEIFDAKAFFAAAELSPLFAFLLISLWAALVWYVEANGTWGGKIVKLLAGTAHFAAHIAALLLICWVGRITGAPLTEYIKQLMPHSAIPDIARVSWSLMISLFFGGMLGGIIMGLYWTITSTLFNMHTGDAFGALGIRHYKHFLRIKLERDRATIFPVALDKVPGRRGWRWQLKPGETRPAHNPQIMPTAPLNPRLIEAPIVIFPAQVKP